MPGSRRPGVVARHDLAGDRMMNFGGDHGVVGQGQVHRHLVGVDNHGVAQLDAQVQQPQAGLSGPLLDQDAAALAGPFHGAGAMVGNGHERHMETAGPRGRFAKVGHRLKIAGVLDHVARLGRRGVDVAPVVGRQGGDDAQFMSQAPTQARPEPLSCRWTTRPLCASAT